MPSPVPLETRIAAVEAYKAGGGSVAEVAARFGFSAPTLQRLLRKHREGQDLAARPSGKGRPPMLDDEGMQVLVQLLEERPQSSLEELRPELERRTGKTPSLGTLYRYTKLLGYRRRRPVIEPTERPVEDPTTRYREVHRRSAKDGYPSDLTDPEWEVVASLFDHRGPGRPPKYERRRILDAIFYVVRSGCSWRMLPKDLPPWENVYDHFRRWSDVGLFEQMHDLLRQRWREREGRAPEPTAGIVDSQSVKTTEKGGLEATTEPRRSRAASVTSS